MRSKAEKEWNGGNKLQVSHRVSNRYVLFSPSRMAVSLQILALGDTSHVYFIKMFENFPNTFSLFDLFTRIWEFSAECFPLLFRLCFSVEAFMWILEAGKTDQQPDALNWVRTMQMQWLIVVLWMRLMTIWANEYTLIRWSYVFRKKNCAQPPSDFTLHCWNKTQTSPNYNVSSRLREKIRQIHGFFPPVMSLCRNTKIPKRSEILEMLSLLWTR